MTTDAETSNSGLPEMALCVSQDLQEEEEVLKEQLPTSPPVTRRLSSSTSPSSWQRLGVYLFVLDHVAIASGHAWQQQQPGGCLIFLQRWGLVFGLGLAFDVLSDLWLDHVRLQTLERQKKRKPMLSGVSPGSLSITNESIWKAHESRKEYHAAQSVHTTSTHFLPWLQPGNWHYETAHCLRDAVLSLATMILYLWNVNAFAEWWITIVWGTYAADMFTLVVRSPAIAPGWLQFVTLHHATTGAFLAVSSFASTQPLSSVVRAIAFVWCSNVFTTGLIVYRSLYGADHLGAWIAGFTTQRLLRWTGAAWATVDMITSNRLLEYSFTTPTFHICGYVALIGIEIIDCDSQLRTIHHLWRAARHSDNNKPLQKGTSAATLDVTMETPSAFAEC